MWKSLLAIHRALSGHTWHFITLCCSMQVYVLFCVSTSDPHRDSGHEQLWAIMVCLCCRCQFLEEKHNKAISRDTWVQLLDFVRVMPTALCTPARSNQLAVIHLGSRSPSGPRCRAILKVMASCTHLQMSICSNPAHVLAASNSRLKIMRSNNAGELKLNHYS